MNPITTLDSSTPRPDGFSFGALHCGIKQARPDLAIIRSERPCAAAGVFTQNPARAPSVERDAALVPRPDIAAIVVNSGNANAMTGEAGVAHNRAIAEHAAASLGVGTEQVLTMSTGVVGVPLPVDRITNAMGSLVDTVDADPTAFAHAILTTDTCTKVAAIELSLPGAARPVRLLGVAKGSGMIHPNMATTLGFVCTDADISAERLQAMLSATTKSTFNAICVDGDTSTNDAVAVLANGASGVTIAGPSWDALFAEALHAVVASLARQVVLDGEGATRIMEVEVRGAPSDHAARVIARGVCRSSLVKCSMFAGQADWGRVAAAAGQAIVEHELAIDPRQMSIAVQGIELYSREGPRLQLPREELVRRMREPTVRWSVHVGTGTGTAIALGCDLSYDYVRINADEAQQIEVTHDGVVRRDPGLDGYSPRVKHKLLVDGLAYVRRFSGLRLMVYVPPAVAYAVVGASPEDARIDKLARDLELCLDASVRPLLVVPTEAIADQVLTHMQTTGHYCARVECNVRAVNRMLDRGYLSIIVDPELSAEQTVDLSIKLAMQKLIVMGVGRGLRDADGFVSSLERDEFAAGLAAGRFEFDDPSMQPLAAYAVEQGVPALHLVDLRLSHALVGELFTDDGIGTLVTRQAIG